MKVCSLDFPKAVPWLPKNITMCDFFEFHESNHIWISSPFYTEMKVSTHTHTHMPH